MRFVVSSRGDYYHIIEELKCPFNEKKDYIILKDGEIVYWQNANNYYIDKKLNIEMMKEYISEIELTKWRSEERRQKTLNFSREILNKMIAYKREIKIEEVLNKTPKESVWLAC
jgi:formylmethanofuran dehydrogenase subunit A